MEPEEEWVRNGVAAGFSPEFVAHRLWTEFEIREDLGLACARHALREHQEWQIASVYDDLPDSYVKCGRPVAEQLASLADTKPSKERLRRRQPRRAGRSARRRGDR